MAKHRATVFIEKEDWDYIQKFAEKTGVSGSALMRDCVVQFVTTMRRALGDDLDRADANRFMRVMLLESSNALADLSRLHSVPGDKNQSVEK